VNAFLHSTTAHPLRVLSRCLSRSIVLSRPLSTSIDLYCPLAAQSSHCKFLMELKRKVHASGVNVMGIFLMVLMKYDRM